MWINGLNSFSNYVYWQTGKFGYIKSGIIGKQVSMFNKTIGPFNNALII